MNEANSFLESIRHVRIYIEYAYAYDGMIRRDLSSQHVFLYERSFCNNGSDSKDKTKPQIHENQFCLITFHPCIVSSDVPCLD